MHGSKVVPQSVPTNIKAHMWFQHDGANAHFSADVRSALDTAYPGRWIGWGGPVNRPTRSPDLSFLDFFLWGNMKSLLYVSPVDYDEALVARIAVVAGKIREMSGVFANVRHSLRRSLLMGTFSSSFCDSSVPRLLEQTLREGRDIKRILIYIANRGRKRLRSAVGGVVKAVEETDMYYRRHLSCNRPHSSMKRFTNTELADMHFIYRSAEGNARASERFHRERYPQKDAPDHRMS
ncbi:uncharacterized protein TNCV_1576341 [Trichonephila clavipes]|nr:uncharacterized protein TNCV_1576341 [Trichonephila clavipes]